MSVVLGMSEAEEPWFWGFAAGVALSLLLLNLLLLAAVHLRRLRQFTRGKRERRFRERVEQALVSSDSQSTARDVQWLRDRLGHFSARERPIAATMLIERMRPATEEERGRTLDALREAAAVERIAHSLRARLAWRRALAARTLGWIGADEAVGALVERLGDRNRYVRESAVRALGRIRDPRALSSLEQLLREPSDVGTGVVYDAILGFGAAAEPVFREALSSEHEEVRVSACFGVAQLCEPDTARRLLEALLDDLSASVRSAAATSLGEVGGGTLPEALARAAQDQASSARTAATGALGSFDDPRAVELAVHALDARDRDTAVRAGEALVRLARGDNAGAAAKAALHRNAHAWPVEWALTYASLGSG